MRLKYSIIATVLVAVTVSAKAGADSKHTPACCGACADMKSRHSCDSIISISNSLITVKQDLRRGGSICHVSKTGTDRNLVNIYDEGRYIQQSYYAGKHVNRQAEGQSPSWSPWTWNPIQGGNYAGKRARITAYDVTDSTMYVACVPMLWDMNNHEAEALMEQWTTLRGNTVEVRNKITCHRTDTIYGAPRKCDQEIPAVYPISSLKVLYSYFGNAPFTNAPLDKPEISVLDFSKPGSFWGKYPDVPEKWMAFTDGDGWGMGVYSPRAERFLAGRFMDDTTGEEHDGPTSYIAPLCTSQLDKDSEFEYTYYIIIDGIDSIREKVYELHGALQEKLPVKKQKNKKSKKTKNK